MSEQNASQKHSFQAEVAQLLHLVTHSLYSNPEIFLRELISNASDACDKLRFEGINHPEYYEDAPDLRVRVSLDKDNKTITISDNGIGLSEQEAIDNLGTMPLSELVEKSSFVTNESTTVVYFVSEDCLTEEGRVKEAGGEVIRPKSSIGEFGFISLLKDTEGNTIGLHSMK